MLNGGDRKSELFFLVFANTCLALSICVQQDRGLGLLSAY